MVNPAQNAERISADDHHGEKAFCQMCDAEVQSRYLNKIWQWVHVTKCRASAKKK